MDTPWYQKGLKFKCTGCGKCCSGSPGYVWITHEESLQMAALLNLSYEEFIKRYTRKTQGRLALLEKIQPNGDYDCIFLKERQCSIYQARPKQCRTYPWWKENVSSPKAWEETGEICEGINHPDAPLISLAEIEKGLKE